jgi:branched-chain amino acid transport system permease protein
MIILAESLVNGLLIGGIYGLVAIGMSLMFGVMKLINFAHGEFLMAAMYVAFVLLAEFGTAYAGVGIYWMVIPTVVVMAGIGYCFYKFLLRRTARFGEGPQILLTIGLSIGLQGLAQVIFGADFHMTPNDVNGAAVNIGPLAIKISGLVAFVAAALVAGTMAWTLRYTQFGRSVRAVAENASAAQMLGIDSDKVFVVTTVIACALAGLAGALLVPDHYTFPLAGQQFVVMAFLAIVIAGLGNIMGSMFGGLLMGVIQSLTAAYWEIDLSTASIYVLFIVVLLFRPEGLFTRKRRSV